MAEVNRVAAAAAMAKRPNVRLVIMGFISVVEGVFGQKSLFADRERIGIEKLD
jgi:hypothetical protein